MLHIATSTIKMQNETSEVEPDFKKQLLNCYSQQLMEVELLSAMFANPGEFSFTDSTVFEQIKEFENTSQEFLPGHLDFTIKFKVDKLKLEIYVNLPHLYPDEEPDIMVRCNDLNRYEQTQLNTELNEYMKNIERGNTCIYSLVSWIQENVDKYNTQINYDTSQQTVKPSNDKFARYWIYSHHIYNKRKREMIQSYAKENNLTGFCLPGKPGIICIEGGESSCKEWWKIIKSLTWQKILIRKTEIFEESIKLSQQKFKNFEEIHLQNPSNKNSKHMDMGMFSKYMEKHGCIDIFNDFFGIESNKEG